MKAMIFAAGLGTRLRPLTDTCPKALIPVGGKPILQILIERLKQQGISELIINIHYLGEQILQFLDEHHHFGLRIEISDETSEILETGGGLWKAKDFFDDGKPFLVCNADILTNIDIRKMLLYHEQQQALATLAVRSRSSSRYLLFDEEDTLCGWKNEKTMDVRMPRQPKTEAHAFAFSGYQILSPEIFTYNQREGKFSMIDWYLDLCRDHLLKAYHHDEDIWVDIGSIAELERANELVGRM